MITVTLNDKHAAALLNTVEGRVIELDRHLSGYARKLKQRFSAKARRAHRASTIRIRAERDSLNTVLFHIEAAHRAVKDDEKWERLYRAVEEDEKWERLYPAVEDDEKTECK